MEVRIVDLPPELLSIIESHLQNVDLYKLVASCQYMSRPSISDVSLQLRKCGVYGWKRNTSNLDDPIWRKLCNHGCCHSYIMSRLPEDLGVRRLLVHTCNLGNLDSVKQILNRFNMQDLAMKLALSRGHCDIVEYLILSKPYTELDNYMYHVLVQGFSLSLVNLLDRYQVQVDFSAILLVACNNNKVELVEYILCRLEGSNFDMSHLLYESAICKCYDVVKLLLSRGAVFRGASRYVITSLIDNVEDLAWVLDQLEIKEQVGVEELLPGPVYDCLDSILLGADPCNSGYTLDRLGYIFQRYSAYVQRILTLRDYALFRNAVRTQNLEVVKYIVSLADTPSTVSAMVHAKEDKAICLAAIWGSLKIASYLIETHGLDVITRDNQALVDAALSEDADLDMLKYLIDKGANIHARDGSILRQLRTGTDRVYRNEEARRIVFLTTYRAGSASF